MEVLSNCTFVGECCSEAVNGHVLSSCQRNGVPSKDEGGAQRFGSKKLHVSVCTKKWDM